MRSGDRLRRFCEVSRTTAGDWVAFQPSKGPDSHHFTYHESGETHYKNNLKSAPTQAKAIESPPNDLLDCEQLFVKSFENFNYLMAVAEAEGGEICEIDLGADYARTTGLLFAEVLIGRRFPIDDKTENDLQLAVLTEWEYPVGPNALELRVRLVSASLLPSARS